VATGGAGRVDRDNEDVCRSGRTALLVPKHCYRRRSLYCRGEIPQHPLLGPTAGQDAFWNPKYLPVLAFETGTAAFQSLH